MDMWRISDDKKGRSSGLAAWEEPRVGIPHADEGGGWRGGQ